jgi:hypothetical protein
MRIRLEEAAHRLQHKASVAAVSVVACARAPWALMVVGMRMLFHGFRGAGGVH